MVRFQISALLLLAWRHQHCHGFPPRAVSLPRNVALTTDRTSASVSRQRNSVLFSSRSETITDNDVDGAALLQEGRTFKGMWRPDKQDVERISWGKPAKKKGTGSRGVPHRLNQEERQLFDQARTKGFLEVLGSAWRAQRSDAPLMNTYRSWCDACAQVSIVVHKSSTGVDDAVVVDISPLRLETAAAFQAAADACLEAQLGGFMRNQGGITSEENDNDTEESENESPQEAMLLETDAWETRPIYQLPPYCIVWDSLQRAEAKQLAKTMATLCQTAHKKREKASKKPVGVKHGKGRRHGGYGIG